jgi:hypothetical protein
MSIRCATRSIAAAAPLIHRRGVERATETCREVSAVTHDVDRARRLAPLTALGFIGAGAQLDVSHGRSQRKGARPAWHQFSNDSALLDR